MSNDISNGSDQKILETNVDTNEFFTPAPDLHQTGEFPVGWSPIGDRTLKAASVRRGGGSDTTVMGSSIKLVLYDFK